MWRALWIRNSKTLIYTNYKTTTRTAILSIKIQKYLNGWPKSCNNQMKWSHNKSIKPVLIIWPDISWRQVNRSVIVRPCSGPVWRCTASGRNRCIDSHRAHGPRWRRLPPDRWGRGNCGCRCRRRAPLPPNCSEERISSAPLDWKAVENQENVRNGRR